MEEKKGTSERESRSVSKGSSRVKAEEAGRDLINAGLSRMNQYGHDGNNEFHRVLLKGDAPRFSNKNYAAWTLQNVV